MATYVNDLRLKEIATGDESGTWGDTTNTNLELIAEAFSYGTEAITTNADTHTTTIADGATDPGRSMYLKYTGTLDSACTITIGPNTVSKMWFIENATSGSQNIIISQGSGANITIPPGDVKVVYTDGAGSGAAVVDAFASLSVVDLKVQDDLTVTDDLIVNGDIDLEGNMDVNGSLETDALSLNGTTVTSTAAEINLLDGSSANTVVNSKAVIYGSSGEVAGTLSTAAQPNITSLGTLTGLTTSGDINFGDSDKAVFGAGSDLQIYHDGSNSFVADVGTGVLDIQTNGTEIQMTKGGAELMAKLVPDGAVTLYYDAAAKIATTSTGIDVTGTATMDGLTVDGTGTFNNNGNENLFLADTANNTRSSLQVGGALTYFNANIDSASHGIFAWRSSNAYTERMRIDSAGNVGIGTTSPTRPLTVNGNNGTGMIINDATNDKALRFRATGDAFYIEATNNAESAYANLALEGNVGIGTNTPSGKLEVKGSGTSPIVYFGNGVDNAPNRQLAFSGGSSGLVWDLDATGASSVGGQLTLSTNGTERVRIDASGNVGIGTTSPFSSARLQVNTGTNLNLAVQTGTALTNGMKINAFNDAGSANIPLEINGSVMVLKTGETERMRIDSSGNVRVGVGNTFEPTIQFTNSGRVEGNPGYSFNGDLDTGMFNPSSQGTIAFSNNGTESVRIDSSGNLLVGKTATGLANAGIEATASNILRTTKANSASAEFNRTGTDGDIAIFWKDTSTVGSIGTEGGDLTIGTGDVGLKFNDGASLISPWDTTANAPEDGLFDLGYANGRFKDLYLSGGAYLGGTGAANHLDDYEEGTFTPNLEFGGSSTGITFGFLTGVYIKIGRLVTIRWGFLLTSKGTSTGNARITGLPFTIQDLSYADAVGTCAGASYTGLTSVPFTIGVNNNTQITLSDASSTTQTNLTDANFTNGTYLFGIFQYTVS